MSQRQDKKNPLRTISTRERGNVAPFTRTVGKAHHIREIDAGYPNRAQRRASMGRDAAEVALQRLLFEKRRSDLGVATMNDEKRKIAEQRREYVAKNLASWHEMQERNERFRIDFSV